IASVPETTSQPAEEHAKAAPSKAELKKSGDRHEAEVPNGAQALIVDGRPKPTTGARPRLLNRELSWLEFNSRVLALAESEGMPLLERAKFLAIFASNLDEF